jgi:hypothetical protein
MSRYTKGLRAPMGAVLVLLTLSACSPTQELILEPELAIPEETAVETEIPTAAVTFIQPTDCTQLLPASSVAELADEGAVLLRGLGSGNPEPIFAEGQTPEELVGGISCLYGPPSQDDSEAESNDSEAESNVSIIVSVAPVDEAVRPQIISDLISQKLNIGQTNDGAATYWIWGDDANVPALHNTLYQDSWYSALIAPGGRSGYEKGAALVVAMRSNTSG